MTPKDIEAYKKEMMMLYSKGKPENEGEEAEKCEKKAEILNVEALPAEEKEDRPIEMGEMEENGSNPQENNAVSQQSDIILPLEDNTEVNGGETQENVKEEENAEENDYDDYSYDEGEHDTAYFPYTGDDEEAELDRIISATELSDPARFSEPELVSEESLGNSSGYILVNVRTGHEASPIVGASVIVTAVNDGRRLFIAAGQTDISGTVLKLEAPAPAEAYSQIPDPAVRPYSLFDVSVRANGFFNARSVDVPVFSGVTSIQNFNMIPLPIGGRSGDDTLTYFNQEPNY